MGTKKNTKKNLNHVATKDNVEKEKVSRLKELNINKEQQNGRMIAAQHTSIQYSGPIPHPSDFEKYEKVLKGSADRILAMAENQSIHRQSLEKAAVYSGIEDSKRGQYFAFILAVIIIIGGFYLISIDKDAYGVVAIVGSVSTLIGVFLLSRKDEQEERKEKNNGENNTEATS